MDIKALVIAQKNYFLEGNTRNLNQRINSLRKLRELLKKNEKKLFEAIYADFGKSEYETYETELSLIYHEINKAIKKIPVWARTKRIKTNLPNLPAKSYIIAEPLGTALIIGAWNYPYQLSLIPLISAIAAGCTAIVKPSELSAHSSRTMAEIINSNFDSRYISVLQGGVQETGELLEQHFDKIFFTGSIPVGKIVYEAAAKHLTPVTLELGGKSPVFVLNDCNIKITAKRIIWGKFLNAGQTCVAPDYLLVDSKIIDKLLAEIERLISELFPNTKDVEENYVRIINEKHFNRLADLIEPEKIYCGGHLNKEKLFISPTIFTNVDFDSKIMADEIFGPLLPVIAFDDLQTAIFKVKSRPKPLALYVFGKNGKNIDLIMKEISFGGGAVNDTVMHLSNGALPFGGVGSSGTGNYHEHAGFKAFSHYKSILHKRPILEPFLKYRPYTTLKLNILKRLLE